MITGRKRPYTAAGLRRLKCARCSAPATAQWQICADGNLFRPICTACDIELNRMVLVWMRDRFAAEKIARYAQREVG